MVNRVTSAGARTPLVGAMKHNAWMCPSSSILCPLVPRGERKEGRGVLRSEATDKIFQLVFIASRLLEELGSKLVQVIPPVVPRVPTLRFLVNNVELVLLEHRHGGP